VTRVLPKTPLIVRAEGERDPIARMAEDVRAGLAGALPSLPCKYFYDDRGSELFDAITRLPEYYQTRAEERILERIAGDVMARARPRELVELGSGLGRKVRLLLAAAGAAGGIERLVLFDVNERGLEEAGRRLLADHRGLAVTGIVGDFASSDLELLGPGGGRLVVFFAGTIGNLHPSQVPPFLGRLRRCLAPDDTFLVGLDLVKDEARLHAAYNDGAGVTAEFNRNILRVVNDRLDGDFDPAAFDHVAFYDRERAWIEMRLRARRPVEVRIRRAGLRLRYEAGAEIRTEISCKYTRDAFEAMLPGTGLVLEQWYTDHERLFALALLRAARVTP
jgi:L-histidine N-alpha-methyltransferase